MGVGPRGALKDKRSQFFFIGWYNLKFFAVLPANCLLFCVPVHLFWNKTYSWRLLRVPSPLCLAYKFGVLFDDHDQNTQCVQQMLPFEFVALTLGAFL